MANVERGDFIEDVIFGSRGAISNSVRNRFIRGVGLVVGLGIFEVLNPGFLGPAMMFFLLADVAVLFFVVVRELVEVWVLILLEDVSDITKKVTRLLVEIWVRGGGARCLGEVLLLAELVGLDFLRWGLLGAELGGFRARVFYEKLELLGFSVLSKRGMLSRGDRLFGGEILVPG